MAVRRYSRVSRREQSRDSSALERQQWRLENSLTELGVAVADSPHYCDVQSGREDNREFFQKLLAELNRGDWVVVARIDRIARDTEFNAKLAKRFKRNDITVYEVQIGRALNWDHPSDWDYFIRSGLDAEMEVLKLSKRVRDGKQYAREKRKANSHPPYGYSRVAEKYVIDDAVLPDALALIGLLEEEQSFNRVVRRINQEPDKWHRTWSVEGLRRWFHNPVLRGHTGYGEVYQSRHRLKKEGMIQDSKTQQRRQDAAGSVSLHGEIAWDTHPDQRLLTDERYGKLCLLIKRSSPVPTEKKQFNLTPLSGLLRCGKCGSPMVYVSSSPERRYYTCSAAKSTLHPDKCEQRACVRVEEVESHVIAALQRAVQPVADKTIETISDSKIVVSDEQIKLERQLAQLNAMGFNPALEIAKADIRQQIANLNVKSEAVSIQSREAAQLFATISSCFFDESYWPALSKQETRDIFHSLVSKVNCSFTEYPQRMNRQSGLWCVEVQLLF